jgi:hypothetical protein
MILSVATLGTILAFPNMVLAKKIDPEDAANSQKLNASSIYVKKVFYCLAKSIKNNGVEPGEGDYDACTEGDALTQLNNRWPTSEEEEPVAPNPQDVQPASPTDIKYLSEYEAGRVIAEILYGDLYEVESTEDDNLDLSDRATKNFVSQLLKSVGRTSFRMIKYDSKKNINPNKPDKSKKYEKSYQNKWKVEVRKAARKGVFDPPPEEPVTELASKGSFYYERFEWKNPGGSTYNGVWDLISNGLVFDVKTFIIDGVAHSDGDPVPDLMDNCPDVDNEDQTDTDGDEAGDACDICPSDPDNDIDLDGVCGDVDNCPDTDNPGQEDEDLDGIGDACDACPSDADNDADGDGVCGDVDNCPGTANADQADNDGDGDGDACDTDDDNDGVPDDTDNCPVDENPGQDDSDGDGIGDVCDPD